MAGETEVEGTARLCGQQEHVDMHACVYTLTYVYMYLFIYPWQVNPKLKAEHKTVGSMLKGMGRTNKTKSR